MKLLLLASVFLSATSAFAANCLSQAAITSRCDVQVTGSTIPECRGPGRPTIDDYRGNYPGHYPGRTSFPQTYSFPFSRVAVGENASTCEVSLEDCKYFAFKKLEKFRYTSNCGDISFGKSVEYRYQTLNNDGTVAEEIFGRMRK